LAISLSTYYPTPATMCFAGVHGPRPAARTAWALPPPPPASGELRAAAAAAGRVVGSLARPLAPGPSPAAAGTGRRRCRQGGRVWAGVAGAWRVRCGAASATARGPGAGPAVARGVCVRTRRRARAAHGGGGSPDASCVPPVHRQRTLRKGGPAQQEASERVLGLGCRRRSWGESLTVGW
jgi:hypothetical protein